MSGETNHENTTIDPKLTEALKGVWDSLTDEQKEKAKECKTPEELTALAGKAGIELPDEVLDAVAGGYITKALYEELWLVVDDTTCYIMASQHSRSRDEAEKMAADMGLSTAVIDADERRRRAAEYDKSHKKGCG